MKKIYVVLLYDGYVKCKNKKDARETVKENPGARCIYTRAAEGNYYHNRVKTIRF